MNVEQIEYELTLLKGKVIVLIIPLYGSVSMSICGSLEVVEIEHRVGFHVHSQTCAIIFNAEDVQSLEPSKSERFTKTIRLKKS